MIFTSRFFLLLALAVLLSLGAAWEPEGLRVSFILSVLLFSATLLDLLLIPRDAISIERVFPAVLTQGAPATVTLVVRNRSAERLRCQLHDSPPAAFIAPVEPLPVYLKPRSRAEVSYPVRSHLRGEFFFGSIFYRVSGPLGLVLRQEQVEAPAPARVFPDIHAGGRRDLALSLGTARLIGRRLLLHRGESREFESLREHRHDDDFRDIDWKATAKKGKLISRQYQMERDQRLLLMIDLGRLMSARIGPYRKLDYAINAAVQLAQTALHQGDWTGLLLFSQEIAYYLPPRKGPAQLGAIVQALVSAQPRRLESNYRLAFHYAAHRNHRRTLMVCFTDLPEPEAARSLIAGMTHLRPRHLPLAVTISDSELQQALKVIPREQMDVYRHAAAQEVWNDYQRTICSLQGHGVLTVNVPAADLTVATVNRYLTIKETARL
jgi:uncharacterized protein (DUF58 family)